MAFKDIKHAMRHMPQLTSSFRGAGILVRLLRPQAEPCFLLAYERPFNIVNGKFDRLAYNLLGGKKNNELETPVECAWREFCEETGCSNKNMKVDRQLLNEVRKQLDDAPLLWVPAGKYTLFVLDITELPPGCAIVPFPERYRDLPRELRAPVRHTYVTVLAMK